MHRAQTEVKKFLEETQRQIDEEGLLGMSGTNFDKGDSPRRVLKAKQFEARMYSGGLMDLADLVTGKKTKTRKGSFSSVARIAQELNAFNLAFANGDFKEFSFDDSSGNTGVNPYPYKDDVETYFDDSELEVTKGCGGCCDYDVCWPDQAAIDRSVAANKIMNRVFAQSHRKEYADAQMKKYFWKDDVVERVLQLEREGKTRPYYDY